MTLQEQEAVEAREQELSRLLERAVVAAEASQASAREALRQRDVLAHELQLARHPNIYRDVQVFNLTVLPGMVDRTEEGLSLPPVDSVELGLRLVAEEVEELADALGFGVSQNLVTGKLDVFRGPFWYGIELGDPPAPNLVDAADAIADILYVVLGVALRIGMNEGQFRRVWEEVTRCNMDKGRGPLRADGKRLKPEDWIGPPDVARALLGPMHEPSVPEARVVLDATDGGVVPLDSVLGSKNVNNMQLGDT